MRSEAVRPELPAKLQALYPFLTRAFLADGLRMSFAEAGRADAPPLLLVHGNPTWSFLFRDAILHASDRFRVIAPDHIGFGLSDKPKVRGYHTLDRHIENLTALIADLNLERVTLVLHEWGGPIGLGWATRFPEKVERVILINTCGFGPSDVQDGNLPWLWRLFRGSLGDMAVRRMNLMLQAGLPRLAVRKLPPAVAEGYRYPFRNPDSRTSMVEFARMSASRLAGSDQRVLEEIGSRLRNISARVEILWGKRDPILRSRLLPYLLRDAFPNAAEPVFLEQASHLVPEDAPDVLVDKLLEPFRPKPKKPQPLFNILK